MDGSGASVWRPSSRRQFWGRTDCQSYLEHIAANNPKAVIPNPARRSYPGLNSTSRNSSRISRRQTARCCTPCAWYGNTMTSTEITPLSSSAPVLPSGGIRRNRDRGLQSHLQLDSGQIRKPGRKQSQTGLNPAMTISCRARCPLFFPGRPARNRTTMESRYPHHFQKNRRSALHLPLS